VAGGDQQEDRGLVGVVARAGAQEGVLHVDRVEVGGLGSKITGFLLSRPAGWGWVRRWGLTGAADDGCPAAVAGLVGASGRQASVMLLSREMSTVSGSSYDPDGHGWQVMWMDPTAAQHGPEDAISAQGAGTPA
jgi:hypothetical protein